MDPITNPSDTNTPAPSDNGVNPTPAPATPGAPASPVATPQAPAASPTPSHEASVPSYRLREQREAYERQFREREAAIRAEEQRKYQELERKLHALAGVAPPANPEVESIKQQFYQVFPEAKDLLERSKDILGIIQKASDFESVTQHHWDTYARQQLDKLFSLAQETYGGPLSDEGKRILHSSFVGFVNSSPEMQARFNNDPSLVEEYWRSYTSNFVDPTRRAAAAGTQQRAAGIGALPQDSPGGVPRATPTPKPSTLDERVNDAWARFQTDRQNR